MQAINTHGYGEVENVDFHEALAILVLVRTQSNYIVSHSVVAECLCESVEDVRGWGCGGSPLCWLLQWNSSLWTPLGHSMSNQHKKRTTPSDFHETWSAGSTP